MQKVEGTCLCNTLMEKQQDIEGFRDFSHHQNPPHPAAIDCIIPSVTQHKDLHLLLLSARQCLHWVVLTFNERVGRDCPEAKA